MALVCSTKSKIWAVLCVFLVTMGILIAVGAALGWLKLDREWLWQFISKTNGTLVDQNLEPRPSMVAGLGVRHRGSWTKNSSLHSSRQLHDHNDNQACFSLSTVSYKIPSSTPLN